MLHLVLAAALALAPEPTATTPRAVAEEVSTLLEAGKVNEALAVIEAANAADPDPRYLFMRAALEEQLGRCTVAVPLYREFAQQAEDPADREEALAGLERCGAEPEPEPEPVRVPEPEPVPPRQAGDIARPGPEPIPPTPWREDRLGWALLGSGAAVATVGGVILGVGVSAARDTRTVSLQSEYRAASVRASRLQPTGIALLAVGAAVWAGGVVRMALVDRDVRQRTARTRRFDGFSIFF